MVRRVAEKLILIFFGIALPVMALVGVEIILRIFPVLLPAPIRAAPKASLLDIFKRDPLRIADSELVYRYRSKVVTTALNEDGEIVEYRTISLGFPDVGFRDDGLDEEKEFRVVVLGDSFTQGGAVNLDDTWVEQLEQQTKADLINLGVGGYGTVQERILLERYGMKLEPDLVILALFTGNDFGDNGTYEGRVTKRVDERLKRFFGRYFYSYEMLKYMVGRSGGNPHLPKTEKLNDEELAYESTELKLVFHIPHFFSLEKGDRFEWISKGAELATENILRIQEMCDEREIEFLVLICPSKEQVYWDMVKTLLAEPERYDPDWPNSLIERLGTESGIHVLDLTPVFRAHSGDQIYFTEDTHWNVEGNRLAAEATYNYLVENGLLPVNH
ncbi:MAG: hypothetical protein E3J21_01150 [Anaerolineales bacterium]|nr:MAG: hypothetical protein E3J21_01150 [Anaerolineales bacterium]